MNTNHMKEEQQPKYEFVVNCPWFSAEQMDSDVVSLSEERGRFQTYDEALDCANELNKSGAPVGSVRIAKVVELGGHQLSLDSITIWPWPTTAIERSIQALFSKKGER
jgi:hypothetical protein